MTEKIIDPCSKPEPLSKPALHPKSENENNITISLGDMGYCNPLTQPAGSTAVTLQPNPIALNIRTETDWPTVAVGLSSATIAIIVAYLSHKTQKNQVRANIASIRAKWIEELRETAAKFLETATLLINNVHDNKKWFSSKEATDVFSSLIYTQTKISLMLDKSKNENKTLIRTSEGVIEALKDLAKSDKESGVAEVGRLLSNFESQISSVLEKAWGDIKSDLNPTLLPRIRIHFNREHNR